MPVEECGRSGGRLSASDAVAAVPGGWQSLTGILANDPEAAVYLVNFTNDHGATSRAISP